MRFVKVQMIWFNFSTELIYVQPTKFEAAGTMFWHTKQTNRNRSLYPWSFGYQSKVFFFIFSLLSFFLNPLSLK